MHFVINTEEQGLNESMSFRFENEYRNALEENDGTKLAPKEKFILLQKALEIDVDYLEIMLSQQEEISVSQEDELKKILFKLADLKECREHLEGRFKKLIIVSRETNSTNIAYSLNKVRELKRKCTTKFCQLLHKYAYQINKELAIKKTTKKLNFSAICVQYFEDDPTDEELGAYAQVKYSYRLFSFEKYTTLQDIMDLAVQHWNIKNTKEYVLTDISHNHLNFLMDVKVVDFFIGEQLSGTQAAILVLRKANLRMQSLLKDQEKAIIKHEDIDITKEEKKKYTYLFNRAIDNCPGLKDYSKPEEKIVFVHDPINGHWFSFIVNLAVLIMFVIALLVQNPIADRYYLKYLDSSLGVKQLEYNLKAIYQYLQFYTYEINNNLTPFYKMVVPIGIKRIAFGRTKQRCKKIPHTTRLFCSCESDYNQDTKNTSTLYDGSQPWMYYQSASHTRMLPLSGEFSDYDGSGYIFDYPSTMTLAQSTNLLKKLKKYPLIDKTVRYILVDTLYFDENNQYLINIIGNFELSPQRIQYFSNYIYVFKMAYLTDESVNLRYKVHTALLVMVILSSTIDTILHVLFGASGKRDYNYIHSMKCLINLGILFTYISFFALYYTVPNNNLLEYLVKNKYLNITQYGIDHDNAYKLLCLSFTLYSFKFLNNLNFTKDMLLFFRILGKVYKESTVFFFFYLILQGGFTMCLIQVYGLNNINFINFVDTFFSFMLAIDFGTMSYLGSMYTISPIWTGILLFIQVIFIPTIFLGFLLSALTETLRYITTFESSLFEQETLGQKLLKLTRIALSKYEALKKKFFDKAIPSKLKETHNLSE